MFSNSQFDQNRTSLYATEPMVVSSGSSPGSPYLPGFLIGDANSSFTAASPKLWTIASANSPSKRRSPSPTGRTTFPAVQSPASHTPRSFGGRLAGEKAGGPPVQGLFESFSSPIRPEAEVGIPRGRSLLRTSSRTSTPSQQADTSYSQRDNSRVEEMETDDTWVTVFGFPPGATSYILQQFSQYGTVLEHRVAPNGNWVHIRYQSKLQAKKALSKNGKVFGDTIMVGVKPCADKVIVAKVKNILDESCKENVPVTNHVITSPERLAGIRPLTQAYRMAANEREVTSTPPSRVPQKTGSLVSKAMEYVFSW